MNKKTTLSERCKNSPITLFKKYTFDNLSECCTNIKIPLAKVETECNPDLPLEEILGRLVLEDVLSKKHRLLTPDIKIEMFTHEYKGIHYYSVWTLPCFSVTIDTDAQLLEKYLQYLETLLCPEAYEQNLTCLKFPLKIHDIVMHTLSEIGMNYFYIPYVELDIVEWLECGTAEVTWEIINEMTIANDLEVVQQMLRKLEIRFPVDASIKKNANKVTLTIEV